MYRALLHLGLTDAFRALHPETHAYTYWDYQGGAWPKDHGIRIDHLLLSPQAADRLEAAEIDKGPRGKDKASDHTPAWCALSEL
jgi:exodeoxyribonuclease-3